MSPTIDSGILHEEEGADGCYFMFNVVIRLDNLADKVITNTTVEINNKILLPII